MDREIVTYSSNFRRKKSLYSILQETFLDVKKYRWQILLAIKKQIKSTYQQDTFGLFWVIVMPIIPMGVYMVLAHIKVFNSVDDMPFVFFIAIGMFTWLLMATIIRNVMLSVKKDKAILKTTDFPVMASMLSQLGEVLNESFIRLFAVAGIMIWYAIDSSLASLLVAFLAFVPIILISFSIGVIVAMLDMVMQDTRRVVDIFLRYGLFVSSVIFPFPTEGLLGSVNGFNFFNTSVVFIRDTLYYGEAGNVEAFAYTSLFGVFAFLVAMKLVYSMDYKIRAYL